MGKRLDREVHVLNQNRRWPNINILVPRRHLLDKIVIQLYIKYLFVEENLAYPLMTFSIASNKSFSVMAFLLALMANIPASVQTDRISAPVAFGHFLANNSNLIFLLIAIVLAKILKM